MLASSEESEFTGNGSVIWAGTNWTEVRLEFGLFRAVLRRVPFEATDFRWAIVISASR